MKTASEPTTRCPFADCQSDLTNIPGRIIAHSRPKTHNGWKRRRLCKVCGKTMDELEVARLTGSGSAARIGDLHCGAAFAAPRVVAGSRLKDDGE